MNDIDKLREAPTVEMVEYSDAVNMEQAVSLGDAFTVIENVVAVLNLFVAEGLSSTRYGIAHRVVRQAREFLSANGISAAPAAPNGEG